MNTENNQSENPDIQEQISQIQEQLSSLKKNHTRSEQQILSAQGLLKLFAEKNEIYATYYEPLMRLVGYALLGLTFFDYLNIVLETKLMNPEGELQLVQSLVQNSPTALLGLLLIFYQKNNVNRPEKLFLTIISWLCLFIGIGYFCLVPLGISSTILVSKQNITKIESSYEQQKTVLMEVKQKVNQAKTNEELVKIINPNVNINPQQTQPKAENIAQLKGIILADVNRNEEQAKKQVATLKKQANFQLWKSSIRYIIGAVICATFFILIWRITWRIMSLID
jgi:hypothetical protein